MVKTTDFRTKTIMDAVKNVTVDDYWPIALDIGYSSVKSFSPNSIVTFPSYAKKIGKNPDLCGGLKEDEILYRDSATKEVWVVGSRAQNMLNERSTEDSQEELFGRNRYFTPMFQVIARTGLALSRCDNQVMDYNKAPIAIQTGLPAKYLKLDKPYLLEALTGRHKFSIKTHKTPNFVYFDLDLPRNMIDVMSQPHGTLMNISMDDNGETIPSAQHFFNENTLIFDGGFGTGDIVEIWNRIFRTKETFLEYGMKEVLARTGMKTEQKYGVYIQPSAMQRFLDEGEITIKTRSSESLSSRKVEFADLLEEASNEVCRETVARLTNIFSGLFDYQNLILSGGTCIPWQEYICGYFKEINGLNVVAGNLNCPELDLIFCNARGYYMYMINVLRAKKRNV